MSHEVDRRLWIFAREAMEAIGEFDLIAVRYLDSAMSIARKGSPGKGWAYAI